MQSSHAAAGVDVAFDDPNLIADAGLVPVVALAEQVGLPGLVARARHDHGRGQQCRANPDAKVMSLVAGMVAGADSIEDIDRLRQAGNAVVFDEIRAPSTLGTFLRAVTHGHVQQLNAVLRQTLIRLTERAPLLPGADCRSGEHGTSHRPDGADRRACRCEVLHRRCGRDRRPLPGACLPDHRLYPLGQPANWSPTPRSPRSATPRSPPGRSLRRPPGRVIVRRVRRLNPKATPGQDGLFDVWRHHTVFVTSGVEMLQAESQHRGHAITEQVIADAAASALAHLPSATVTANAAWAVLWAIAHNLTRAAAPWPARSTPAPPPPPCTPRSTAHRDTAPPDLTTAQPRARPENTVEKPDRPAKQQRRVSVFYVYIWDTGSDRDSLRSAPTSPIDQGLAHRTRAG